MRVLHVIQRYWPSEGGAERYMREISARLAAEGHAVTVMTTDADEPEFFWNGRKRSLSREQHKGKTFQPDEIRQGVAIRRFPIRHLPLSSLSYPAVRRVMSLLSDLPLDLTPVLRWLASFTPWVSELAHELRTMPTGRYDLVMGMTICFESLLWPACQYARRAGVPFIVTPLIHLGESERDSVRKFYTMRHQLALLHQADAVIALTNVERDYLVGRGVAPDRITTAGAGADPADVEGGDAIRFRERHSVSEPIVVSLGTASYDKGTVHTVEAMRQLWAAGQDVTLVVAGAALDQFRRYIGRLSPVEQSRCRVLGVVDDQTKRDLLAAARVLVMPSRSDSFGIVYLEAWLAGLPVVGADSGGVAEVIDDGADGFLVKFGDVDALAHRIGQLLGDQALAQQMAVAGRRKAFKSYSWDRVYARVRRAYNSLETAQRGRHGGETETVVHLVSDPRS